jgi:hypothetical protein
MARDKLFAEVVIAGSYKDLAKSTRGAKKELNQFEKTAKKISAAVNTAFAGIAIAGIGMVWDALVDMTTAAQEDAASVALLNKQMEKSWKATDQTKDSMNEYIDSVSNMSGIMDDDLRPAFGKIVRATKNSAKAQKAFNTVMDISADTGKDVNVVAAAYSKYLVGNKTMLYRLIPGLKDAANEAQFLNDKFDGMSEVAGANNPIGKLSVIFENFKEKLGASFLPILNDVADWLASPEATKQMDKFAKSVENGFAWFGSAEGKEAMEKFLDNILKIADGINKMIENIDKLKPLMDFFMTVHKLGGGWIWDVLLGGSGEQPQNNIPPEQRFQQRWQPNSLPNNMPNGGGNNPQTYTPSAPPVNIYIDAPYVSGPAVVNALKTEARRKGVPLKLLIT